MQDNKLTKCGFSIYLFAGSSVLDEILNLCTPLCKNNPACLNFRGLAPASLSNRPQPAKLALFGTIWGKNEQLSRNFSTQRCTPGITDFRNLTAIAPYIIVITFLMRMWAGKISVMLQMISLLVKITYPNVSPEG